MQRALVAAVGSLLVCLPALGAESPEANTGADAVAAARPAAETSAATSTPTDARTEKPAIRKSRHAPAEGAASKSEASQVKQVPLKGPGDGTVCRTEYPTGSRIGVKRCYSTTETASSKFQNEIMQHDLQEMRDRQMREQIQRASVAIAPPMQSPPGR